MQEIFFLNQGTFLYMRSLYVAKKKIQRINSS